MKNNFKYRIKVCKRCILIITDVEVNRYKQMKESDMAHAAGHEIIIVKVKTDAGVTGISFIGTPIFSHGEVGDIAVTLISRNLRNIVVGENPLHTQKLWMNMFDAPWRMGMRGMILDCMQRLILPFGILKEN